MHSVLLCRSCQCGKVCISRNVLFAGSFVRIRADRMLANRLQGSAMAAGKLLFASVAVVDGDEESGLYARGDVFHELLCGEGCLDAFVSLGMDRVAIKKIEFLRGGRCPGF